MIFWSLAVVSSTATKDSFFLQLYATVIGVIVVVAAIAAVAGVVAVDAASAVVQ